MPDWVAVILLGVIEGVTEFLPVSSTGHLLIAERWLAPRGDLFNSVVQCGAVLAVLLVFWTRLKQFLLDWRKPATRDYVLKLIAAFGITAIGGLALKAAGYKQQREGGDNPQLWLAVAWATLIGGVVIIAIEYWLREKPKRDEVTWGVSIGAGIAQLLAVLLPGTSRSAATILTALVLGMTRPAATEFSFLLGVPTLLAAGSLQIFSAVRHHEIVNWPSIALGTAVATVTAFATVKWLIRYVQTHTFIPFGWYRIVMGAVILFLARR